MRRWIIWLSLSLATLQGFGQTGGSRFNRELRHVLIEQITSSYSPFVPDATLHLDSVLDRWQQVIPVSLHTSDPMQISAGITSMQGLGATFAPGFWIDRVQFPTSALEVVRGDLQPFTALRVLDSLPGKIELIQLHFDSLTRVLDGTAQISFSNTASADFRVNLYVVEDSVTGSSGYYQANYYDTVPGHPYFGQGNPIVGYPHPNVVRQMLGGTWGRDSIVPNSVVQGDTFLYPFSLTLPTNYVKDRVSVVPILQVYHPDSSQRNIWDSRIASLRCEREPDADFGLQNFGTKVEFTDSSEYGPQIWHWDFGDGTASTLPDPDHYFPAAGQYQVTLIVDNACGSDTTERWVQVTCQQPESRFFFNQVNGLVQFRDSSEHYPTQWFWDFGDGSISTLPSPSHSYSLPGTYTVCLITQNPCGADTACQTVVIACVSPFGSFNWNAVGGLTISFTSTVSPSVSTWFWYFGDGSTSNSPNPTYVFSTPGTYQVCLTVGDSCGNTLICQQVSVGCPIPVTQFTYISSNYFYEFTDQSTNNPTTWVWRFGDGASSPLRNPVHTYPGPGIYTVCLVSSNACGADTLCRTIEIDFQTGTSQSSEPIWDLYPLPAQQYLNLRTTQPLAQQATAALINLQGQVIGEWTLNREEMQWRLDWGTIPAGWYIVEIRGEAIFYRKALPINF